MAISFLDLILDSVKQMTATRKSSHTSSTDEAPDIKPQSMSYSHSSENCPLLREWSQRAVSSCVISYTCINCGTSAPSDPPECRGTCRHHLVAHTPAKLEWLYQVYRSKLSAGCGYAPVHRRLWLLWLWCLLPRWLVLSCLATSGKSCLPGSSFDMGTLTPMAGKTGKIYV